MIGKHGRWSKIGNGSASWSSWWNHQWQLGRGSVVIVVVIVIGRMLQVLHRRRARNGQGPIVFGGFARNSGPPSILRDTLGFPSSTLMVMAAAPPRGLSLKQTLHGWELLRFLCGFVSCCCCCCCLVVWRFPSLSPQRILRNSQRSHLFGLVVVVLGWELWWRRIKAVSWWVLVLVWFVRRIF